MFEINRTNIKEKTIFSYFEAKALRESVPALVAIDLAKSTRSSKLFISFSAYELRNCIINILLNVRKEKCYKVLFTML